MKKLSKIDESVWGDIRKRSSGEVIRREDFINSLDLDGLCDYLNKNYECNLDAYGESICVKTDKWKNDAKYLRIPLCHIIWNNGEPSTIYIFYYFEGYHYWRAEGAEDLTKQKIIEYDSTDGGIRGVIGRKLKTQFETSDGLINVDIKNHFIKGEGVANDFCIELIDYLSDIDNIPVKKDQVRQIKTLQKSNEKVK